MLRRPLGGLCAAAPVHSPPSSTAAAVQHPSLRAFTLSRAIAQTWLIPLTYVPAAAPDALVAAGTTAAAAAAGTTGGGLALFGLGLTSPALILFGCGVLARLSTLPLSLLADRSLARLSGAMPELLTAYADYVHIAEHPKSVGWERKVAKSKLKRERQRIFSLHGTGGHRPTMLHASAAAIGAYFALFPAAVVQTAAPVTAPLLPLLTPAMAGPSLCGQVLASTDLSLAIAAAITGANTIAALHRRRGFNDNLDRRIERMKKYLVLALAGTVGFAFAAPLLAAAVGQLTGLWAVPLAGIGLPSYLGPFWLGAALTGTVQPLIHRSKPMKFLLDLPDYAPTHGTYGTATTGAITDRDTLDDDAASQLADAERTEQWRKHKALLDFECNVKIYQTLKWVGISDKRDDFDRERSNLALKLATVRKEKEDAEATTTATSEATAATGKSPSKDDVDDDVFQAKQ